MGTQNYKRMHIQRSDVAVRVTWKHWLFFQQQ